MKRHLVRYLFRRESNCDQFVVEVVAVVDVVEVELPPPARAATPAAARAGAITGTKFCTSPTGGRLRHAGDPTLAGRAQSSAGADCAIALVVDNVRAEIVRKAYFDMVNLDMMNSQCFRERGSCTARESNSS